MIKQEIKFKVDTVGDLIDILERFDRDKELILDMKSKGLQSINKILEVELFEDDEDTCILIEGSLSHE